MNLWQTNLWKIGPLEKQNFLLDSVIKWLIYKKSYVWEVVRDPYVPVFFDLGQEFL